MPVRSSLEKSPIDASVYEGLQVDTRAKDNKDPFLDDSKPQGYLDDDFDGHHRYMDEKQAHLSYGQNVDLRSPPPAFSPRTPGTTFPDSPLPPTPQFKNIDSAFGVAETPPAPRERRICGLKKKHFWEIFGLILALIIAAAVVGGVVGGLQSKNADLPNPTSGESATFGNSTSGNPAGGNGTSSSQPTNTPVLSEDVLVDSPINVVSYDAGGNNDPASRQSFRVYYQSVIGNVKEAVSEGQTSWQGARPIFTDALNNTGLATVTYFNNTQPQGSIFYVGMNGLVQEKRKILNSTVYWEPGTINALNLPAVGNISIPSGSKPDPKNGVGSYAMAAVYSQNFSTGPGIRLFYHAELLNGTSYVQEMIWTQDQDVWTKGTEILDVWPNSKLAAAIDDTNNLLRLFFTTGNETLQEMYLNITDSHGAYQSGNKIVNYLSHNTADIAVVCENDTTYVYHYATVNQTANVGIHEMAIRGTPGSTTDPETYSVSEPLVSSPQLSLANNGQSAFQPLAATKSVVSGVSPGVYVFWADKVTGDPQALSGYHALSQTSRLFSSLSWSSTSMAVPLGSSNSQPSRKRSLPSWLRWIL